jgi:hypothetical protein
LYWVGVCVAILLGMPASAFAQTDEIQVYDGGLAPKGVFNLTLHNNFTPKGIKEPAFDGAVVSHHSWNGVPEWAYGVSKFFEAGLYLPLYSRDETMGWGIDGMKLRALFAVPNADDRKFFYGANFEFSINAKQWDTHRVSSEVRPIVGWHFEKVDLIFNPIVDTAYDGFDNLEFVPSARLAFKATQSTAIALETYSDFGPVKGFLPTGEQAHQLFWVIDHTAGLVDIEAGFGVGLTSSSDRYQLKLILSRDLNKKK